MNTMCIERPVLAEDVVVVRESVSGAIFGEVDKCAGYIRHQVRRAFLVWRGPTAKTNRLRFNV